MKRTATPTVIKRPATPTRNRLLARLKFFQDIYAELHKVIWPTRQEAIRLTVMTLVVSAVVGLFLGVIDFGFTNLINFILSVGK